VPSIALLLIGPAFAACQSAPAAPVPAPPPLAVRVARVQEAKLTHSLDYVGTVRYRQEIRVRSQVAGTLADMPQAPGSVVEKGAVLARISAADASARTQRVRYELERAGAEHDYACDKYETDRRLVERNVIAPATADASRKACDASRASRKAARAQLAELSAVSARSVERASGAATVLEWLSEPGENVGPGQPLLLLGAGELEIEANVAEEEVRDGLSPKTRVELEIDGKWLPASIARIAPVASGPSRSVEVRVALPEAAREKLRAGAAVDTRFVLAESGSAASVPADAIGGTDSERFLFVIEDGTARRRAIQTGIRAGGRVQIITPIPAGARVAVSGLDQLRDGVPVFAVEPPR
jgi:membrane fusion protein, multidrug efflux system